MRILTIVIVLLSFFNANSQSMDYYGLARSLALKEGKHLCVLVRSNSSEDIEYSNISDTIIVTLHHFEGCQDGEGAYGEYRTGGWHEWVLTMRKDGSVKYQKPTVKPNLTVRPTYQQSLQIADCPTGN